MSVRSKVLSAAVLSLLVAAGVFWLMRSVSDSAKVTKTLKTLCVAASKPAGENPALSALKLRHIQEIFEPKCHFDFRFDAFNGTLNPTEITSHLVRIKGVFRSIDVDISGLRIEFSAPGEAKALFAGSFEARGREDKGDVSEVRDVVALLKRDAEGHWKIASMSFHEVLEK